uniref:Uncharacterized protein n=1 Tax=Rhizophora mucronata TaxID=61149 RepID=A0A2P2NTN2_RHIMU
MRVKLTTGKDKHSSESEIIKQYPDV